MSTPHRTPDDGRPSPASCARFAGELHDELATSRMAWEAALLRSDAAVASGDRDEVATAIEDHRQLLAALEDRVSSLVGDVVASREPEAALAAPTDVEAPTSRQLQAVGHHPSARQHPSAWRRAATSLLGAAAAVAVAAGLTVGPLSELGGGAHTLAGTGQVATGQGETPGSTSVELQVAGERVVVAVPFAVPHVVGPVRELARFSGSLPAPTGGTPDETASDRSPSADVGGVPDEEQRADGHDHARSPGGEPADGPADEGQGETLPAAEESDPTDVEEVLPSALEELGARPGEREPEDGQVTSSVPAPLVELTERIRRGLRSEPASEPETGLR